MNAIQTKHVGYFLGAVLAFGLATLFMFGIGEASAAEGVLGADDFFGGNKTGAEFASTAGLGSANLVDTIAQIIRVAMGFLGVIAVVIILLGGFKWMTAGGNEDKVKKAKQLIFSGIIGLVIILSAFAIASFVITQISGATAGGGGSAVL
jgi:hypothetical protein